MSSFDQFDFCLLINTFSTEKAWRDDYGSDERYRSSSGFAQVLNSSRSEAQPKFSNFSIYCNHKTRNGIYESVVELEGLFQYDAVIELASHTRISLHHTQEYYQSEAVDLKTSVNGIIKRGVKVGLLDLVYTHGNVLREDEFDALTGGIDMVNMKQYLPSLGLKFEYTETGTSEQLTWLSRFLELGWPIYKFEIGNMTLFSTKWLIKKDFGWKDLKRAVQTSGQQFEIQVEAKGVPAKDISLLLESLCAILEEGLLIPKSWFGSDACYQFQDKLYIDFSSEEKIESNFEALVQRIHLLSEKKRLPNSFDTDM